jgi:alpha-L-fucosidase 2
MKTNWSLMLLICLVYGRTSHAQDTGTIDAFARAKRHNIVVHKPAPRFFEGALLGNGALGVVVTTRPDAVVLYLGHNNVWDIRLAEKHREELQKFDYVFDKVKNIPPGYGHLTDDPWYADYVRMAGDNYAKPYPRPFPCGSVLLGVDRRQVQVIGHTLDISSGVNTVRLATKTQELNLKIWVDMHTDRLLLQLTDSHDKPCVNVFDRVRLIPDPSTPADIPRYTSQEDLAAGLLSFRQVLPYRETGDAPHPKDKAFRLTLKTSGALSKKSRINWSGNRDAMVPLEAVLATTEAFHASVTLEEGWQHQVSQTVASLSMPTGDSLVAIKRRSETVWKEYWSKSAVAMSDTLLEEIWYRNLYFLNCATKPGTTCPGLFANWSHNRIGTAWHGDYHLNYNTQQPFWVTFSSNHLDKNLAYVDLIEKLMPVSTQWARDYYNLPGAYFPHSAFPVDMTMNPYPLPDWGWEICETPWAVQGLWWHYRYSGDIDFLRTRAYGPIKAAVQFLVAYMKRPDAHGAPRWKDNKYHIFPSVPPELYGLRPGFQYNYDCTADLALTKFVFRAFQQATALLGTEKTERATLADIRNILEHFPEYPVAPSKQYGQVLVAVPGEHDQVVYNVPNPLFSVFPGEDHGLHSDAETQTLLKNTYHNQQNEGGNDLVFINLQAARIGQLDLEAFKRHVRYSLLPNGTATDMVMQAHGRYGDQTDFAYMADMGIWFENVALPAVINECLLQSYNGTLQLFPNWPGSKDGAFQTLRAAGAFLVSAAHHHGHVAYIRVLSEKGNALRLVSPWGPKGFVWKEGKKQPITTDTITLQTRAGEEILFTQH